MSKPGINDRSHLNGRTNLSDAKRALLQRRLHGNNNKSSASSWLETKPELCHGHPIPPAKRGCPLPVSFEQERLWFLYQLEPNATYNIPLGFRIKGQLNQEVLERCLDQIIQRHETLRTRFETVEDRPVQVIEPFISLKIPLVDLCSLPQPQREAQAMHLCTEEARSTFDLNRGDILKVKLFRLEIDDHFLFLNMHHIASDGWSVSVFFNEMNALYRAFIEGKPSPLPELPVQYADFAVWRRQWLQGEVLEKQLGYWKKQLLGAPELLELPADRPRPTVQSYNGAIIRGQLPATLAKALHELSRTEGTTMFMTLLAAFQTLLHRYTGSQDILVGTPVSGRQYTEIEGLIGFFVNTLVMRGNLSGNPSFRILLGRTRDVALEAYAHQNLPFEKLVQQLHPQRNMSHAPVFQVLFGLQNEPETPLELTGLDLTPIALHTGTSKFDLSVFVKEHSGALELIVEFSTDLFEVGTVRRLLGHYQTLLEGIISNPDENPSRLPLMTESQRHEILVEWNRTETKYPKDRCLHELIEEQVLRTPEAVAVVFEGQKLTYRELNARATTLARHLQRQGVGPDVLVGICADRSLEMVVGLMGILKAGGAYVPLDPQYPKDRLAFMLEDSAVTVLLTQAHIAGRLPGTRARIIRLDADWQAIATENGDIEKTMVKPEHLAYMIYTSGSTGRPKGALNTHRGIVNRLLWMQDAYRLIPTDRILQKTPFSFDVSVWEFFWPLLTGARLVLARPGGHKDPVYLSQLIAKEKITTLHFVPSMLQIFLEQEGLAISCSSLKRVICSGEVLSADLQKRFFSGIKAELHNLYGPTEASVDVTYWRCQRNSLLSFVPIGKPIANVQIYILDEQLQPAPIGVPGELHIGGVGLARAYHNRSELTAEKFIANPFSAEAGARLYKTGDLARYLPDGNIEYLGRLDHQVKIRGFRVEPGEIAGALNQHPGIQASTVIAREDTPGDKRLIAYLVNRYGALSSSALREYLRKKLPEHMVPSAFVTLKSLPLTPNGKIDRNALPRPELEFAGKKFVPPATPMEMLLAEIWHDVLQLKEVGIHDNFFELGGHSLMAVQLIAKINKSLDLHLSVPVFFQNPTINKLATVLDPKNHNEAQPRLIPLKACAGGALFLLDASIGLCRLAQHLDTAGLAIFATTVPLSRETLVAASRRETDKLPGLQELAAAHATLILRQKPLGPCFLVGYSFGGLLAFEVAHQLQQRGRQIDGLIMLDSWLKPPRWYKKLKVLTFARAKQSLKIHASHLWSKIRTGLASILHPHCASKDAPAANSYELNPPIGNVPWEIWEIIYQKARTNYTVKPLETRAILFRSKNNYVAHLYPIHPHLGWDGLFSQGLQIVEVPGDHFSFLKDPQVLILAQRLIELLKKPSHSMQTEISSSQQTDKARADSCKDKVFTGVNDYERATCI
jgi:amino acid adenylation domain-containing protein